MGNLLKLILFYSTNETIEIKDVESEIFTENRDKINFCFFHNKELHFSKSVILKRTLIKEFENIQPKFKLLNKRMTMIKSLPNFDTTKFDAFVNTEYEDYLKKINYRIECIFQTISLFINLYKNNNIVFVLPLQLNSYFQNFSKESNINTQDIKNMSEIIIKWDLINWINYYLKKDIKFDESEFNFTNIKKMLKINI